MATDKKPAKKGEADEEFSTFRIYATDGEVLSEVAKLLGLTVADAYRQLVAQEMKRQRVKILEEKLKQAKQ